MYKPRKARKHRSFGGKMESGNQYNAQGSPEDKEEHAKSDGFKRGGSLKRADGGHVEGEKAKMHLAKRARGGKMEEKREERARGGKIGHGRKAGGHHGLARGGSPFSSARSISGPGNSKGSPGETAPVEP